MRRWRSLVFASLTISFAVYACSLEEGGTSGVDGTDGSTSADGTILGDGSSGGGDGSSGSDSGGSTDGGGGTDGSTVTDSGPGELHFCGPIPVVSCVQNCPGFPILCGAINTCVADCSLCGGFRCDACFSDGGYGFSTCEPQDASALSECLGGFARCGCGNQGDCPGPNQTCKSNACFECGEPDAGNTGDNCKSGTGPKNCHVDGANFGKCM